MFCAQEIVQTCEGYFDYLVLHKDEAMELLNKGFTTYAMANALDEDDYNVVQIIERAIASRDHICDQLEERLQKHVPPMMAYACTERFKKYIESIQVPLFGPYLTVHADFEERDDLEHYRGVVHEHFSHFSNTMGFTYASLPASLEHAYIQNLIRHTRGPSH